MLTERIADGDSSLKQMGISSASNLKGKFYPYNIVDGALFLIGFNECNSNACSNGVDSTCPLVGAAVCDSLRPLRFRYDRKAGRFLREVVT